MPVMPVMPVMPESQHTTWMVEVQVPQDDSGPPGA